MESAIVVTAIMVDKEKIVFASELEIQKVYALVKNNDNFVLSWKESGKKKSILMIADKLLAQIQNGDLTLTSEGGI